MVPEQLARVHGLDLCYETFGDPSAPPLLLVMGLGGQMIWWDEDFCEALAARGFHVIRYDNRDAGRSTILSDAPVPSPLALLRRDPRAAVYSLEDMTDDAAGLLDHLGIEAAHVVGVSMGGMIAQTLAIRHPARVLSLASISSTTGDRGVGRTRWRLYPIFARRPVRDRDAYIAAFERVFRAIASRGYAGRRGARPRPRRSQLRPLLPPGGRGPPAGGHRHRRRPHAPAAARSTSPRW